MNEHSAQQGIQRSCPAKAGHAVYAPVMPHCRTTVTEQNFVTCETNYISKTNGRINTKYKELS